MVDIMVVAGFTAIAVQVLLIYRDINKLRRAQDGILDDIDTLKACIADLHERLRHQERFRNDMKKVFGNSDNKQPATQTINNMGGGSWTQHCMRASSAADTRPRNKTSPCDTININRL